MKTPARQPRSHIPCVIGLTLIVLILGGLSAGSFFYSLKWKARFEELNRRTPGDPRRVDKVYRRAGELLETAERYAWVMNDVENARSIAIEAEERHYTVLNIYPEWADVYFGIARCRALRFDYAETCTQYLAGLSFEENERARFELGMAYYHWYLLRASALRPSDLEIDDQLGVLAREAERHLYEFATNSSETARKWFARAVVAMLRDQSKPARDCIQLSFGLDDSLPHGNLLLGWIEMRDGDPLKASQKIMDLLGTFRYIPEAHAVRARAFLTMDPPQLRNARGEWERVLELSPNCAEAHYALGLLRLSLEEPDSDAAFARAVTLDPSLKPYIPTE